MKVGANMENRKCNICKIDIENLESYFCEKCGNFSIAECFKIKARPILETKVLAYIEEYRKYIVYICKKRKFLKEHWEDMEQYIILELIQTFPKQWQYDDFDWVTTTVIRRKAIDFTTNFIKKNNEVHDDSNVDEDDSTRINGHFIIKSLQNFADSERFKDIVDYVKHLNYQVNNLPNRVYFSDWDRDFLGMIIDLYDNNCDLDKEDILACMGFDESEVHKLHTKLNAFRNKVKKYLEPQKEEIKESVDD